MPRCCFAGAVSTTPSVPPAHRRRRARTRLWFVKGRRERGTEGQRARGGDVERHPPESVPARDTPLLSHRRARSDAAKPAAKAAARGPARERVSWRGDCPGAISCFIRRVRDGTRPTRIESEEVERRLREASRDLLPLFFLSIPHSPRPRPRLSPFLQARACASCATSLNNARPLKQGIATLLRPPPPPPPLKIAHIRSPHFHSLLALQPLAHRLRRRVRGRQPRARRGGLQAGVQVDR